MGYLYLNENLCLKLTLQNDIKMQSKVLMQAYRQSAVKYTTWNLLVLIDKFKCKTENKIVSINFHSKQFIYMIALLLHPRRYQFKMSCRSTTELPRP